MFARTGELRDIRHCQNCALNQSSVKPNPYSFNEGGRLRIVFEGDDYENNCLAGRFSKFSVVAPFRSLSKAFPKPSQDGGEGAIRSRCGGTIRLNSRHPPPFPPGYRKNDHQSVRLTFLYQFAYQIENCCPFEGWGTFLGPSLHFLALDFTNKYLGKASPKKSRSIKSSH